MVEDFRFWVNYTHTKIGDGLFRQKHAELSPTINFTKIPKVQFAEWMKLYK